MDTERSVRNDLTLLSADTGRTLVHHVHAVGKANVAYVEDAPHDLTDTMKLDDPTSPIGDREYGGAVHRIGGDVDAIVRGIRIEVGTRMRSVFEQTDKDIFIHHQVDVIYEHVGDAIRGGTCALGQGKSMTYG